jgi:eukaryotic-like serine/threonine-protein kinase
MTPERWRRIDDVYHAALAREAEERDAFVAEACAGDEAMRREVVSLLAQNASLAGTLEVAVVGMASSHWFGSMVQCRHRV